MDLYPWQEKVLAESSDYPRRALFAAPRVGKTLATTLMSGVSGTDRDLIVAPLGVCRAWRDSMEAQGRIVLPLYLSTLQEAGKALYDDSNRSSKYNNNSNSGIDCAILNYDKLAPLVLPLKAWNPKGQIYDESHLLKTPSSIRSKAARKLASRADFVRILTGTPSPNHYGDLWAQMTLVAPEKWGSWTSFARKYLIRDSIYPSKIIGHNNVEELQAMLLEDADIIRRQDVFGPDTYQYVNRWVDLPPKARRAYDTLVAEWLYYLDNNAGGVLADHTLTRLVRLQQLASGYLHTTDGQDVPIHQEKIDAVISDLEEIVESGEKAVIFHRFTWEGNTYEREIREHFRGLDVARMDGSTSSNARFEAERGLREEPGPRVLVAQTRTAALGLSFSEAEHAMFVSQSFSFTDEDQARDRIYKPGANRCITFYRARSTVDEFIQAVLGGKASIHGSVSHADIRAMAYGRIG